MLAQSFMSAAALDITEPQRNALQKVLVLLETGRLLHTPLVRTDGSDPYPKFTGRFNMSLWQADEPGCGTVCCIGGTAELVGDVSFDGWILSQDGLYNLFRPPYSVGPWGQITPTQAARALRSYLTCGDAKWAEAVA